MWRRFFRCGLFVALLVPCSDGMAFQSIYAFESGSAYEPLFGFHENPRAARQTITFVPADGEQKRDASQVVDEEQERKKKDLNTALFWASVGKVDKRVTFYPFCLDDCCVIRCCAVGYSQLPLLGVETALLSEHPIGLSKHGRSPLMGAMQAYVQYEHPSYFNRFKEAVERLAKEAGQADRIAVLHYAIQQCSPQGVAVMLRVTDIEAQRSLLIEALKNCERLSESSRCKRMLLSCIDWWSDDGGKITAHAKIITQLTGAGAPRVGALLHFSQKKITCPVRGCPGQVLFDQAIRNPQHQSMHD